MPTALQSAFQRYQSQRAAAPTFGGNGPRPMPQMQPFQGFGGQPGQGGAGANPAFGFQAPNLSWLNPGAGAGPKPAPPTGPNSTGVAGGYNPLPAYNRAMDQWRQQGGGLNQLDQGMSLLMGDVANNQASQQLQFQQGQGLFQQNQDLLGQMPGMILGSANQTAGQLEQQAQMTQQMGGQAQQDWQKLYNRNRGDLMGNLNQSVQDFEKARDGYKDMSAQTTSAMLSGMANDFQSQLEQMGNGIGADGNVMNPAEVQAQRQQMQQQWQGQRYQVASQVMQQQNEVMANLQQAVGQARLGASATEASFDTAGQAQLISASQQRLQAQAMANNLYSQSAAIKNGAQILTIDRMLAGMQNGAALAKEFPYSPTSMFDVFLQMMQLQSAGASKKSGFKFPQQTSPGGTQYGFA